MNSKTDLGFDQVVSELNKDTNAVKVIKLHTAKSISNPSGEIASNATGAENIEVKSLEKRIADLRQKLTDLEGRVNYYQQAISDGLIQSDYENRLKVWKSCVATGKSNTNKKWECSDGYHNDGWYTSEGTSLDNAKKTIAGYQKIIDDSKSEIVKIQKDLPVLEKQLIDSRESASLAAMSAEEKKQYEAAKITAGGQAEAAKITAQAQAEAIANKSNSSKILLIGGVATVLILGTLFIVFRRR